MYLLLWMRNKTTLATSSRETITMFSQASFSPNPFPCRRDPRILTAEPVRMEYCIQAFKGEFEWMEPTRKRARQRVTDVPLGQILQDDEHFSYFQNQLWRRTPCRLVGSTCIHGNEWKNALFIQVRYSCMKLSSIGRLIYLPDQGMLRFLSTKEVSA